LPVSEGLYQIVHELLRPLCDDQTIRSILLNSLQLRKGSHFSVSPSLYLYHSGTHLGDFDDFDDNLRGGLQAWDADCTITQAGHDGQDCL
jgi:hypothetical protein